MAFLVKQRNKNGHLTSSGVELSSFHRILYGKYNWLIPQYSQKGFGGCDIIFHGSNYRIGLLVYTIVKLIFSLCASILPFPIWWHLPSCHLSTNFYKVL